METRTLLAGPEIAVFDRALEIPNGATLDFGVIPPTQWHGIEKDFTVKNLGTETLTLTIPPTMPTGFTLLSAAGTYSVLAGEQTSFSVRLNGQPEGNPSGSISLATNDADESPFVLNVTGRVTSDPSAYSVVQTLDDSGSGFTATAGWTTVATGYQGNSHVIAVGDGTQAATWEFDEVPSGLYRIWVTWATGSATSTNAEYRVYDGSDSRGTHWANQTQAPGDLTADGASWKELGDADSFHGTLRVVLRNSGTTGTLAADAVRIQRIGDMNSIVTFTAWGTSDGFSTEGTWTPESGGYGGSPRYTASGGHGSNVASWTFNVSPGSYRVWTNWYPSGTGLATNAPFTVLDEDTPLATVRVNQSVAPQGLTEGGIVWQPLGGPYEITSLSDHGLVVQLTDDANGKVIADAVRIERLIPGPEVEGPEIDVSVGGTLVPTGGTVDFGTTSPDTAVDRVLTVTNTGNATLDLTSISALPGGFSITPAFVPTSLAPNESVSYTLRFLAGTAGSYGGTLSFGNNDADEAPYNLVLAALVESSEPSEADVAMYLVAKGRSYVQEGTDSPQSDATAPYFFVARVVESGGGGATVDGATVRTPGGTTKTLVRGWDSEGLEYESGFTSKSKLDSAFAKGTYRFTINTVNDGTQTPSLTLPSDAYPNAPHLANWTALQSIDAGGSFTVSWDALASGTTDDFVQLTIWNSDGQVVFATPDAGEPGALDGTETSVIVSAGVLEENRGYQADLMFVHVVGLDETSYPGAVGVAAYITDTEFSLQTVPTGGWLQFSLAAYSVQEQDALGEVTITVTRTGSTEGEVRVHYATSDGTATAGSDYDAAQGTLIFADGVATQTFVVTIHDDAESEGNERIHLRLSDPTGGAVLGPQSEAVLAILDDEIAYGPGTFTDDDGDTYVVKLTGPGTAQIHLDDPDGDGIGPIDSILLEGTTTKSSLSVSVKKAKTGDGWVSIGEIVSRQGATGDGSLKSLVAGKSDLVGVGEGITLAGTVGQLTLGSAASGAPILIGGTAAASTKITVAGDLETREFRSGSTIKSLKARSIQWTEFFAPAVGTISTTAGPLVGDMTVDGAVSSVSTKGGGANGDWSAASFGTVAISGGDFEGSLIATASAASLGKKAAVSKFSVTGGFQGTLQAQGAIASLSTKGGGASGEWSAASFGTVAISGGDFEGSLIATATAAILGKKPAVSKFSVTGDFQGTLHALGALTNVTIGGSMLQSTVAGASIGTFRIGGDLIDSLVLAGANLGADYALGGVATEADTFGSGSIKTFSVGGDVENTTVGAGLDPVGLVFRNGNDEIVDGAKSKISSFTIQGVAGEENYFRAGAWPKSVKIGGAAVNPLVDPRFLDLRGFSDVGTTDGEGSVTLRVAGEEVAFQFLDDSSGHPIPGLVVGVSTGTGTEGIAVLEAFDPTSQYPPRFLVLHGPEEPAAAAQTARLAASAFAEAAEPSVAVKMAESASDTLGKMGAVATVLDSKQLESLPVMDKSVKGLATASGLLEAIGYLAKAADTLTLGSVSKAVGALAPSRVQPVTDRAAELKLIEKKAADATMQNLVLIGLCAATANAPGVAGAELSVAGTQLYKLVDEQTVLNAPEGHLAKVSLGFTDIYVSSETPVVDPTIPFATMSITVTPDQVSPGGLGHLTVVSKDRLGDGQVVPLDSNGRADVAVPVGDYALVYQQENAEPVNRDVHVPVGGVEAAIAAPAAPQVANLTLTATPGITGLLDPGTQIQFSVVARDADGNLVEIDPNQLRFLAFNPQGSDVAAIDPATGLLVIGPDQGAVRVVAEYGTTKSNLILASGLGPAFNLPVVLISDASIEEGNDGVKNLTFDVHLSKASTQTVTVDFNTAYLGSATPGSDYTDVTGTLTFKAGSLTPTKNLVVPVRGDLAYEGNETFAVGLSNPVNARLNLKNMAIATILDDDAPGITLSRTSGLVTTESGGQATFTVKLNSKPAADVTITLASSDLGEGTVSPASLTFTPSNWSTARTVTVKGVDDSQIDGDIAYSVYVDAITTTDPNYAALDRTGLSVACTNRDNDTLGPWTISVTVVGDGYVIDNKNPHKIDTRIGNTLGVYPEDTFPILTAYTSSDSLAWLADWVPEGTSGSSCVLINSDYAGGLALTVYIDGQPLTADPAAVRVAGPQPRGLDDRQIAGLVGQAIDTWAASGLTAAQWARLQTVQWQITDLPAGRLGTASGSTVFLDRDADGLGWFVDPTPSTAEEFSPFSPTSLRALDSGPAAGRVDLLTVLSHELGHILGLGDLEASNSPATLMTATLGPGERRILGPAAVDAVFAIESR